MARNRGFTLEGYWGDGKTRPTMQRGTLTSRDAKKIAGRIRRRQDGVKTTFRPTKGIVRDHVTGAKLDISSGDYRMGKWQWPAEMAYHVAKYNVRPSDAFLEWLKVDPGSLAAPKQKPVKPRGKFPSRRRRNHGKTNAAPAAEIEKRPARQITSLYDKKLCQFLNGLIENALTEALQEYGLSVELNGGRMAEHEFKPKVILKVGATASGDNPDKVKFSRLCHMYGLQPTDYLRTFHNRGSTYRIIGIEPRRRKYPILVEDVVTKKRVAFTASGVNAAFITK